MSLNSSISSLFSSQPTTDHTAQWHHSLNIYIIHQLLLIFLPAQLRTNFKYIGTWKSDTTFWHIPIVPFHLWEKLSVTIGKAWTYYYYKFFFLIRFYTQKDMGLLFIILNQQEVLCKWLYLIRLPSTPSSCKLKCF